MTATVEGSSLIEAQCSDCGAKVLINPVTLRRGSSVREPDEALCLTHSAHRSKMVREVTRLPGTLDQIKALRMRR